GLWIASSLIGSGCRRVLLLAGETASKVASPLDRSVRPLFGDAGTTTAVEADSEGKMAFQLSTDGTGAGFLITPAGGFRNPRTAETSVRSLRPDGNIRSDEDPVMDGPEVFVFTLREVPPLISTVLALAGWTKEDVDAVL